MKGRVSNENHVRSENPKKIQSTKGRSEGGTSNRKRRRLDYEITAPPAVMATRLAVISCCGLWPSALHSCSAIAIAIDEELLAVSLGRKRVVLCLI